MNIVQFIKSFVEEEHKKPTSHYGYEPYKYHILPTVKYATKLAKNHKANIEVVQLAAYLHDIGSVIYGRKDHHKTGAIIAENKLKEFKYPQEKIELVKKCIYNHRGSTNHQRESIEEKIIAEADSMSNFDNIAGIFKAAYAFEGLDQKEAQESVLRKLENKWNDLHFEDSKKIIRPKLEAVKLLLGND